MGVLQLLKILPFCLFYGKNKQKTLTKHLSNIL